MSTRTFIFEKRIRKYWKKRSSETLITKYAKILSLLSSIISSKLLDAFWLIFTFRWSPWIKFQSLKPNLASFTAAISRLQARSWWKQRCIREPITKFRCTFRTVVKLNVALKSTSIIYRIRNKWLWGRWNYNKRKHKYE